MSYNYEKTIVTQSFSKSHSMTGYRIGYVISNHEIIEKLGKLQALCFNKCFRTNSVHSNGIIRRRCKRKCQNYEQKIGKITKKCVRRWTWNLYLQTVQCTFLHEQQINTTELSEKLLEHGLAIAPGIKDSSAMNF